MVEEINLFEFILQMGLEFWTIGEAIPMGFFDDAEDPKMWTDFCLLHPNFVEIEAEPFSRGKRKKLIWLTPSDNLKRIVENGPQDEKTGLLYEKLPSDTKQWVKEGKVLLPDIQVSHIKRTGNYFDVRGESIIQCVLKELMYRDKLRSASYAVADRHCCHDDQTECLTRAGWKVCDQLTVSDEIATVDKQTGTLEYQYPTLLYRDYYKGDLLHFTGVKKSGAGRVDMLVTPNHRMLVKNLSYIRGSGSNGGKDRYSYWKDWEMCKAEDVRPFSRFRSVVDHWEGESPEMVTIDLEPGRLEKDTTNGRFVGKFEKKKIGIPINDYLKFTGYWISEGTLNKNAVIVYQTKTSSKYKEMDAFFNGFVMRSKKYIGKNGIVRWQIADRGLVKHLVDNYGDHAWNKHLSIWIKNLSRRHLQTLLDALVAGDGHEIRKSTYTTVKGQHKSYGGVYREYYTSSRMLSDDVQEIVFKIGYSPAVKFTENKWRGIYTVHWTETGSRGKYPHTGYRGGTPYKRVLYDGIIWCVEVPNGIFVTRRNGKIAIQGNSPFELYKLGEPGDPADEDELEKFQQALAASWTQPNKAIVWHHSVQAEWHGATGKTLNFGQEFDMIENRIMAGLMISKGFLYAEGPIYAATSVALDVLIQRYLLFRMRIANWVERCVMAPICKIHEIYKTTKAEVDHKIKIKDRDKPLNLPKVKWTKEYLRDNIQRINLMMQLADKKMIPQKMILPLLNIDPDTAKKGLEEERKEAELILKRTKLPGAPPEGEMATTLPPTPLPGTPPGSPGHEPAGGLPIPAGEERRMIPPVSHEELELPTAG